MKMRSIIDDKKKARVRDAMRRGDNSIFGKKKAKPEEKQVKKQLSLEEQEKLNEQLEDAIRSHDPDGVKAAIDGGAAIGMRIEIPNSDEEGNVLTYAIFRWEFEMESTIISNPNDPATDKRFLDARRLAFEKSLEVIKVLILKGADVDWTFRGKPFLRYFKHHEIPQIKEIHDLLIKHGARDL